MRRLRPQLAWSIRLVNSGKTKNEALKRNNFGSDGGLKGVGGQVYGQPVDTAKADVWTERG